MAKPKETPSTYDPDRDPEATAQDHDVSPGTEPAKPDDGGPQVSPNRRHGQDDAGAPAEHDSAEDDTEGP